MAPPERFGDTVNLVEFALEGAVAQLVRAQNS
ncbi:MAG: hypothetical protein RL147_870 [Actinomycetota bacterium]